MTPEEIYKGLQEIQERALISSKSRIENVLAYYEAIDYLKESVKKMEERVKNYEPEVICQKLQ